MRRPPRQPSPSPPEALSPPLLVLDWSLGRATRQFLSTDPPSYAARGLLAGGVAPGRSVGRQLAPRHHHVLGPGRSSSTAELCVPSTGTPPSPPAPAPYPQPQPQPQRPSRRVERDHLARPRPRHARRLRGQSCPLPRAPFPTPSSSINKRQPGATVGRALCGGARVRPLCQSAPRLGVRSTRSLHCGGRSHWAQSRGRRAVFGAPVPRPVALGSMPCEASLPSHPMARGRETSRSEARTAPAMGLTMDQGHCTVDPRVSCGTAVADPGSPASPFLPAGRHGLPALPRGDGPVRPQF